MKGIYKIQKEVRWKSKKHEQSASVQRTKMNYVKSHKYTYAAAESFLFALLLLQCCWGMHFPGMC